MINEINLLALTPQGSWTLFFGRFHPLLVHLPIGMLLVAFLLEWMSRHRRLAFLSPAVLPVLIFGAVSAIAACVAGYLLSLAGGYEERALSLHMWMGIGVAVLAMLLVVLRRWVLLRRWWLSISVVMVLVLSAAGHFGGNLTHGEDYLTAALPIGGHRAVASSSMVNVEEAKVYEQLVQPILAQKCYSCHNLQKLKGGLRLDSLVFIRKGGENGPVLKDSMPEASELYKRLVLGEYDDKRMPPRGKPQLSPQELEILYWWIAQGASGTAAVKDLQHTSRIQLVLDGMAPAHVEGSHPYMPEQAGSAASAKDIAALEQTGVKVMPVAAGSAYLMINAVNAAAFSDKEAALLLPLQSQIVWLKLGNTQVGDGTLQICAQLSQLTRLQLENTRITDAGLAALGKCRQLKYLNLVGTKVSDKGMAALKGNKVLKELYVYQTAVTPAGISAFRRALPAVQVDSGKYQLPVLATDTLVYKRRT